MFQTFLFPYQIINNILSAFLGYFLFRLMLLSKLFYKKEALGHGDALFVAGIGSGIVF